MRSLPLTDKTRPGGRPRRSRAPRNAFADWLANCGKTPKDIAKALRVGVSSIYNARNGYFKPGRALACSIAELSTDAATGKVAVPVESWGESKARKRTKRAA